MAEVVECIDEVAGVYFRSIILQKDDKVTQHVHDYDHATYIGSGSVRMWANGGDEGTFKAGRPVLIQAGVRHEFQALENDTRLTCVHNVASAMSVKEKGL